MALRIQPCSSNCTHQTTCDGGSHLHKWSGCHSSMSTLLRSAWSAHWVWIDRSGTVMPMLLLPPAWRPHVSAIYSGPGPLEGHFGFLQVNHSHPVQIRNPNHTHFLLDPFLIHTLQVFKNNFVSLLNSIVFLLTKLKYLHFLSTKIQPKFLNFSIQPSYKCRRRRLADW